MPVMPPPTSMMSRGAEWSIWWYTHGYSNSRVELFAWNAKGPASLAAISRGVFVWCSSSCANGKPYGAPHRLFHAAYSAGRLRRPSI